MAIQNIDDMLLNQITGTEPPKTEVPRGTIDNPVPLATSEAPKMQDKIALEQPPTQKSVPESVKPAAEANEYGDATKPAPELEKSEPSQDADEYGLYAEQQKTFSKAEMDAYANKLIRERLARLERNTQQQMPTQTQQQPAQNQQGFQYDENNNLDWQQQLEQFVFQAADKREQMRAQQIQKAQEQQRMAEFEGKFRQGMEKFSDYHEVVGGKEITDAMVMWARGIKDPASFFYAASKRMPEELAKIAREPDPYAQAAAIGRLDAILRKQANKVSNAPKPLSQTKADTTLPQNAPKSYHNELDQLLLADQAKRLSLIQGRRK
jgi:hypothetical protein